MTPEEEQVRRLLADARHREPMPPDVVARLDSTLADLQAERAADGPDPDNSAPIDLDAARRRRRARTFLVAAAAVAIVGIGVGVASDQLGQSSGDSANSADSGSSASNDDSGGSAAEGSAKEPTDSLKDSDRKMDNQFRPLPTNGAMGARAVITIDPDRFGNQVARLQATRARLPALAGTDLSARVDDYAKRNSCPTDAWGTGEAMMVRYGHRLGVLVFRDVQGDTQVVDLFVCGQDDPVRSITLPAP